MPKSKAVVKDGIQKSTSIMALTEQDIKETIDEAIENGDFEGALELADNLTDLQAEQQESRYPKLCQVAAAIVAVFLFVSPVVAQPTECSITGSSSVPGCNR
jgi:hypothetical protein